MAVSPTGAVDRFLASCVQRTLAQEPWPVWPLGDADASLCKVIAERAEFHGISVLLSRANAGLECWPDHAAAPLREEARLAGLWEETHKAVIARAIEELHDRAIGSVLMKGTALAYLHYEDPAIRRRGDSDLLIWPDDLEAARETLSGLGFARREDPHGLYFQESWQFEIGHDITHTIDLHWEPSDRPILQRILRKDEYFAETVPLPRLSPNACAPKPLLMIMQGAINQAWHETRGFYVENERIVGGRRLIWSVDYTHLTRRFGASDWNELVELCIARDAASIVHSALLGSREDIGLNIPDSVLEGLSGASHPSRAHAYIRANDTYADLRGDLSAARGWSTRWKLLMGAAFPPRHHLVSKHPDLAHWSTMALHCRRYADLTARSFLRAFEK